MARANKAITCISETDSLTIVAIVHVVTATGTTKIEIVGINPGDKLVTAVTEIDITTTVTTMDSVGTATGTTMDSVGTTAIVAITTGIVATPIIEATIWLVH